MRRVLAALTSFALVATLASVAAPRAQGAYDHHPWHLNPATGHYYAQQDLGEWGGMAPDLVTVDDQAEQDWLTATFPARDLFIGLNDFLWTSGTWVWYGGAPAAWTNWAPGEPAPSSGDRVAVMNAGPGGTWRAVPRHWQGSGVVETANPPDGGITGTIVRAADGSPLPGIEARAFQVDPVTHEWFGGDRGTSAADGSYEITELAPGDYVVRFSCAEPACGLAVQLWDHAATIAAAATVHVPAGPPVTGIDAALPRFAHLVVNPDRDWVTAPELAPGAGVTITRDGQPVSEGTLEPVDDGDPRFDSPEDIRAGDVVTVTDGPVTKVHTVTDLAIGGIDGNVIRGSATPGLVELWMHDTDPAVGRVVTSADGTWAVDVSTPGDEDWEQGTAGIGPGSSGGVQQQDEDGDATTVDWRVWSTWVTASAGEAAVNGYDFEPGATVSVGRNGQDIGSATVEDWSDFTLDGPEPFEVGDVVEVTAATTTGSVVKTLTVSGIAVGPIEGNVVHGTGAVGAYVDLGVSNGEDEFNRHVAIGPGGAWSEDLGNAGDEEWETQTTVLGRGSGGTVLDVDQDGDATLVNWHIPNPQIVADLTGNVVSGGEFGGPVEVTIEDPGGTSHTWTDGIEYWDDGFGLWLYAGPGAEDPWALAPGQTITVRGPNGDASLDVADLRVVGWDYDTNEIWGTTDQGGPVVAEAMHADKEYDSFQVDEPGPAWRIGLVDIRIMDAGRVWQFDPEGDLTQLEVTLAPTRFLFSPLFQQVVGSDWRDGATVTLAIDPAATGVPDFTATTIAGPLDCNVRGACPAWQVPLTGRVNVFFDLVDTGFQARAGDVITMSDGTTTKTLTAPALSVDLADPDTGGASGTTTSPMPGFLTVGTRVEGMCDAAHDLVPDAIAGDGSWSRSFDGECGVMPGGVTATETDPDGDQTWTTDPVIDVRVEPALDHVWAAWWAPGNVTLSVERDGSPVHEATVAARNVLTRGSWNLDMWTEPAGTLDAPVMALFDLSGTGTLAPFDIRAGDVVTVSDATVTRSVTVADLAVTGVSAATDIVTGTAAPGQAIGFHLWDGEEGFWGYQVTAGPDGTWSMHFDPGAFPGEGLEPGMNGQAFGPGNATVIRWVVPAGRIDQAITFTGPADQVLGVAPFALVATASSGLPVSFTSGTTGVCAVTATTVRILAAGTCSITASQGGNATYNPAADVLRSFVVRLGTSTAIALDTPDPSVVGQPYVAMALVRRTSPGDGRPSGTVVITDGSGTTCTDTTASAVNARTASFNCTLRSTTAGQHALTATFNPAPGWVGSADVAGHRVTRASTQVSITNAKALAKGSTTVGEAYAVEVMVAVVAPGSGTPSGAVTISDGTAACTVPALSTTGTGSCRLTSQSAGQKAISARYEGTPDFARSHATAQHRVR